MTEATECKEYWDDLPDEDLDVEFEEIADDFFKWKYEQWRYKYESIA